MFMPGHSNNNKYKLLLSEIYALSRRQCDVTLVFVFGTKSSPVNWRYVVSNFDFMRLLKYNNAKVFWT